jgi:ABC-type transport system substrate-binding protein
MKSKSYMLFALLTAIVLVFSACAAPPAPGGVAQAPAANAGGQAAADSGGDFNTPHPILSDLRVRQAIAHCVDRDALIASVYPYVQDKAALRMDSFLPKTHWAYKGPYQDYPHDVAAGGKLLDDAGWKLQEGADYRTNDKGETLALKFTTTTAQFRQTWAAVAEQNLKECGIQLIRLHVPASWWFGDSTGLARRDYELGAFAWVGQADPGGQTLYACNQIPRPSNNWEGQNGMGWCNEKASAAIVAANNTLVKEDRVKQYDIVQQEFAKDMVSLPLFQRAEAEAWSNNLEGLKSDPTEYGSASAAQWKLKDGGDTVVVGFSQEPSSMYSLVESSAVQRQVAQMTAALYTTQYSYDYQPVLQTELSTIEAGLAKNNEVEVKAGDMVWSTKGDAEKLDKGVKVIDASGKEVEYDGKSTLKVKQLVVTYKFNDYTWQDGTAGSIEDMKLAYKNDCDPDSGSTSFITCHSIADVKWGESGLEYTVTYVPGNQNPTYYVAPIGNYPSHQVLSDGRKLADVPTKEWATLPEIAEKPLSNGPFMITEWKKGESITLEANPHYKAGTGVKKIVILIIQDTNQAVAQLLSGEVDYLEKATLGAGAEVQTVLDAAKEGKVQAEVLPSPTWEHIDMNMFVK